MGSRGPNGPPLRLSSRIRNLMHRFDNLMCLKCCWAQVQQNSKRSNSEYLAPPSLTSSESLPRCRTRVNSHEQDHRDLFATASRFEKTAQNHRATLRLKKPCETTTEKEEEHTTAVHPPIVGTSTSQTTPISLSRWACSPPHDLRGEDGERSSLSQSRLHPMACPRNTLGHRAGRISQARSIMRRTNLSHV